MTGTWYPVPRMTQHIGIVACSAEGAALCYRTICNEAQQFMGTHMHPEVSMHTHSLGEYMKRIERDGWKGCAELMLSSSEKLKKAGADFLICPDNTIHHAMPEVMKRTPLPWLHIAEEVANEAKSRGMKRLGITGTRFTMDGTVYPEILTKHGIEFRVPSPLDRGKIDQIIFDELVNGVFKSEALGFFRQVIDRMKAEGCDGVVLGCTEIPLLVSPESSSLPTLDSTRILSRAAIQRAIGDKTTATARP